MLSVTVSSAIKLIVRTFSRYSGLGYESAKYVVASACAFVVDYGVFYLFLNVGDVSWFWSVVLGFCSGAFLAWLLSSFWVFEHRSLTKTPTLELVIFVGIGVLGLMLTQLIMWWGITVLHGAPETVRVLASLFTLVSNFALRKIFLYSLTTHFREGLVRSAG